MIDLTSCRPYASYVHFSFVNLCRFFNTCGVKRDKDLQDI